MHVARQSAQGSIVLFAGNLTATIGQTIASILIARLLGPEQYGSYSLALVIPSLFVLLASLGVNTAVTRFVAHHASLNDHEAAKRFAESALLVTLLSGIALSALCYLSATALSEYLFNRPYLAPYVELASAIVCGQALLNTAIAAAIGWNAMGQASIANIIVALTKLVLSPLLIVIGFGLVGAIAGQTVAAVLGAAIVVVILYRTKITPFKVRWHSLASDARQMVNYGFPVFSAGMLSGVWPYYLSVVLAAVATDVLIGYYQAAYNFTAAISLLSGAVGSALFPAFTHLHGQRADLPTAVKLAVKYVGYVTVPVVFLLGVTAKQLMVLFYGDSFAAGSAFLLVLAISAAPAVLGLTVLPAFFNGIARTRFTLVMVGLGAAVLFVSAPILAIYFGLGVVGLIYGLVLSNIATSLVGLQLFHLEFSSWIDFRAAASSLAAGVASFALCYLVPAFSSDLLVLILKVAVFSFAYLTLAPLLQAVHQEDLEILGEALGQTPVLKRPIRVLIAYERVFASHDGRPPEAD